MWKSLAAQRYRAKLVEGLQRAGGAAGALEEVSAALVQHAGAVQTRLEEIAAAEAWLRGQAERAVREARDLGEAAVDLAGNVVGGVAWFVGGSVDWVQRQGQELAGAAEDRADDLDREVRRLPGGDRGWLEAARSRGWAG